MPTQNSSEESPSSFQLLTGTHVSLFLTPRVSATCFCSITCNNGFDYKIAISRPERINPTILWDIPFSGNGGLGPVSAVYTSTRYPFISLNEFIRSQRNFS